MDYSNIITTDPGKRSGKPCIRGLRVTVYDVLEYVAAGSSKEQILSDFPYLTGQDIQACLAFAADRERQLYASLRPCLTVASSNTRSSDAIALIPNPNIFNRREDRTPNRHTVGAVRGRGRFIA